MYKYDLSGKKVGKLTVKSLVPVELRPAKSHGNYWYCDCDCGTKDIMVPTSYLTGNGNYTQTSCGCYRKLQAFLKSVNPNIVTEEFVNQFDNLEKFLFIHRTVTRIGGRNILDYSKEEYEETISYLYQTKQFHAVYDFWQTQDHSKTFYDYAKPSLDHIIPKSKGGPNHYTNFQFLTVFENLAKRDMTQEEWDNFKKETHSQSDYYIENILEWYNKGGGAKNNE